MTAPDDKAPLWRESRYSTISIEEFDELAPEIHRLASKNGGTLLIVDGGRVRMELIYHDLDPVPAEDAFRGSVLYEGDVVSPIEADGYEPFK